MRNLVMKAAILSVLGIASTQALATGLINIPAAGISVSSGTGQPTGGTSAYALCNQTGNFGSGSSTAPTTSANNTCAVFPSSITTSPVSGFTLVADTTRNITANNTYTNNTSVTIATMRDLVWRNSGNTECIYGKRISMSDTSANTNVDFNPSLSGRQFMEVNDIALGGFSGTSAANLQVGYYYTTTTDEVVFRIGKAFTGVQMQADATNPSTTVAANYYKQPLTTTAPASGTEINGVGQTLTPPGSPTQSQQTAEIRSNWFDFTTDVTRLDEDGTSLKDTAMMYVRAACTSATPTAVADTVRLRQTGQETQPWVTVTTTGYAPAGANANF